VDTNAPDTRHFLKDHGLDTDVYQYINLYR